jgi:hypothetical protein
VRVDEAAGDPAVLKAVLAALAAGRRAAPAVAMVALFDFPRSEPAAGDSTAAGVGRDRGK